MLTCTLTRPSSLLSARKKLASIKKPKTVSVMAQKSQPARNPNYMSWDFDVSYHFASRVPIINRSRERFTLCFLAETS
jgi:hypothetical protein